MTLGPAFGRLSALQTFVVGATASLFVVPWAALNVHLSGHAKFQPLGTALGVAGTFALDHNCEPLAEALLRVSLKNHFGKHKRDAGYAFFANELGILLYQSNRYSEAEYWQRQALLINKKVFGQSHRLSICAANNVANDLMALGLTKEPEDLLLNNLRLERLDSKTSECDLAYTLHSLSSIYDSNGRFLEAMAANDEALMMESRLYGPTNFICLDSLTTKGEIAFATGRYEEALNIQKEVVQRTNREAGADTPYAKHASALLGIYQARCGKRYEASVILADARKTLQRESYKKISDYWNYSRRVGVLCLELDKYDEAEPLLKMAVTEAIKQYGPESLSALYTKHHLAELYFKQKRFALAKELITEVIEKKEKKFGSDNAEVAESLDLYGHICAQTGAKEEALSVFKEVLAMRQMTLDADAPLIKESEMDTQLAFMPTVKQCVVSK